MSDLKAFPDCSCSLTTLSFTGISPINLSYFKLSWCNIHLGIYLESQRTQTDADSLLRPQKWGCYQDITRMWFLISVSRFLIINLIFRSWRVEYTEEWNFSFLLFYTWKTNTGTGFLLSPLTVYTSSSKRRQGALTKVSADLHQERSDYRIIILLQKANYRDLYSFPSLPALETNFSFFQPGSRISYTFSSKKYLIMRPCIVKAFLLMMNSERKLFTINFPPNFLLSYHETALAKLLPLLDGTKNTHEV